MVTRILSPASGSTSVLDYNEKKVEQGNAQIVSTKNLPDDSIATIYDTLEEMEANPAISERTRKKSFHMAFNPGPMDKLSDEEAVKCIQEIMERMGYGDQPIIIYKHFDIEREHFHVVSTRIDGKGKLINAHNEARRLQMIMKEMGQKYGFTMGSNLSALEESKLPVVSTKEFTPGQANIKYSLKVLFEDALKYDFHSLYQFGCIMQAMNVKVMMRRRKDGGANFTVQGLDGRGKPATRIYSLEKHLGYRAMDAYMERLEQNKSMGHLMLDRKVAIREISDYCIENTFSMLEYCSALEEAGIRHVVQRDPDTDEIKRVTLVEKNTYAMVDTAVRGELFLKAFRDAESSGRWARPTKGRMRPLPGAKVRKKDAPAFFNERRTGDVKARVGQAIAKHRGQSAPAATLPGAKKIAKKGKR